MICVTSEQGLNCTVIIFGATGDLSQRYLLPALYSLLAHNKIDKLLVVGAALEDVQVADLITQAQAHAHKKAPDAHIWKQLEACMYYQQLNFNNEKDYDQLAARVQELEHAHGMSGNRLVYCAAASHFFCTLTTHSIAAGLIKKMEKGAPRWHRIVYEKPFGYDFTSAQEINTCIAEHLYEHQIYRIDHYLTKELVSNIALIRFTNAVFEPIWDNRYIDNVQIVLSEKIGVEQRGDYYDQYGALRDVVQNHILELLALVAMEAPDRLVGKAIRDARAHALKKVRFVDGFLGQYDGYQQEDAVDKKSQTDTFAALYVTIDNPRWAGVPFYIKTGKALNERETAIYIQFKQVDCLLAKNCPTEPNVLTIRISPEELFTLTLNARKPGTQQELVSVPMEYCHSCRFGAITPPAYTVVFEEVIRGEQSVSVRFDEIEYAWRLIDAIRQQALPVYPYKRGTRGPDELEQFERKHGMRWRS